MHSSTRFAIMRRTALLTLAAALLMWLAAALFADPVPASRLLQIEAAAASAACRGTLEICAQPVLQGFARAAGALETALAGAGELVPALGALAGDEAASASELLQQLHAALQARLMTLRTLCLLLVLRLCALKALLGLLAALAAAALIDAWCQRRIAALSFEPPLPSVNFWLVQVAAISAAAAAGLAVMPVSAAPGLALAALIAFIAAFSGWVRTFHKFGL